MCSISMIQYSKKQRTNQINGQIRLTIVGTYLPFFSGTSCEKYNETLDKIHAIIDTW